MITNTRLFWQLGFRERFQLLENGELIEDEAFEKISGNKAECVEGPRRGQMVFIAGTRHVLTELPIYAEPKPKTSVTFGSLPIRSVFWISTPEDTYIKTDDKYAASTSTGRPVRLTPTKLVEPI